jgi:hypothetical protein
LKNQACGKSGVTEERKGRYIFVAILRDLSLITLGDRGTNGLRSDKFILIPLNCLKMVLKELSEFI